MLITERLENLGISGKLASIYLALLQLGSAPAGEIARYAGISRTTAYDLLAELSRRRLATQSCRGKTNIWVAEPPESLKSIPQQQLSLIDSLLPDLNALYNTDSAKPSITYYDGVEGIKSVWEEMLACKDREYFYIGPVKSMTEVVGKSFLHDYVARRIKLGVWSNAIRTDTPSKDDPVMNATDEARRRLRYFPHPITGDTVILHLYDNKVAITSTLKEHYGIIIESTELSRLLKAVWHCIWNISQDPAS